ncbi:DUF2807 domain-containing protein [Flavobacterium alkalisoli]|uniref:DUF2807 domain-containing protein n=1 Tax=Flavobacterium alkalisoli TaxID=2602769 RepID=A0A5B9FTP5_9FLAO|nr:head GIN domain-containing protein [Flavobacterium alkalisoli]QEE50325.1 DUF2807 domain-containing protein [Flavobacterium alkalisoli]
MKKQLLLLVGLFTLLTSAAQAQEPIYGNGKKVKEQRTVTEFTSLRVDGPFEVQLVSGTTGSITLEGCENILQLVETDVTDRTLTIHLPKGINFKAHKNNKVKIKIPYYTSLNEVYLKGSGTITANPTLKTNMKVMLEGAGSIDLDLYAAQGEACVLGSGTIKLTGAIQDFQCKVIGSGSLEAKKLECANVDVTVSGSGNADIVCNKAITGKISGSGNVIVDGNPKTQDLKRQGGGEFRAAAF